MRRFLCILLFAMTFPLGGSGTAAFAQQPEEQGESQAAAAKERRLAALIEETIYAARVPEIYADLRYTLRELYLPYFKDFLKRKNGPDPDPEVAERIAALVPAIEYSLKAADELDPVLKENREAMIGDAAALLAKYMTPEEVRLTGEMLRTPAARKGFNILYAVSRLITGYSREDIRSSQKMSEWMRGLHFDLDNTPFADKDPPPPPRERVEKAEAIVSDFIRISRIDDMVGDVVRFTNDVLLKVDTLNDEERDQIRTGIQQFEFLYNLGKSMSVAVAPSALASALNDEQLDQFHLMILSPVMAKGFGLLYNVVREATAFTVQDIREFRALAEQADAQRSEIGPGAKALMEAEWEALAETWRLRLWNRLSPETREGLERSFARLEALAKDAQRKFDRPPERVEPAPGETQL
jgi:hypothetical protein